MAAGDIMDEGGKLVGCHAIGTHIRSRICSFPVVFSQNFSKIAKKTRELNRSLVFYSFPPSTPAVIPARHQ